jgi:hypothetical protein
VGLHGLGAGWMRFKRVATLLSVTSFSLTHSLFTLIPTPPPPTPLFFASPFA